MLVPKLLNQNSRLEVELLSLLVLDGIKYSVQGEKVDYKSI